MIMIRALPALHRWDGVALAVLVAFWAIRFSGVMANLGSASYLIPGDHDDALEQAWMSWWAGEALTSGELDLLHCPLLNHPYGSNAMSVSIAYVHVSLSGLVRPLFGPIGAINAVFVAVSLFVLLALYRLFRAAGTTRAFACGASILFSVYAIQANGEYPDLELANYGILAQAIAAWLSLLRRGGIARFAIAVVLTAATAVVQSYYGIELFALLGLGIFALAVRLAPVEEPRRGSMAWTAAVLAAGAALALVPLLPSLDYLEGISRAGGPQGPAPAGFGPAAPPSPGGHGGLPAAAMLSLVPLAALAFVGHRRSNALWFAATALFLVLALGQVAVLWPGGPALQTPFGLLREHLPLLWRFHYPRRFALPAALCLCVLLGRVAAHLSGRRDGAPLHLAWTTAAALLSIHLLAQPLMARPGAGMRILPPLLPMPTHPMPPVPPVLAELGEAPGDGLLMELGWESRRALTAYYQTVHQHPIPNNPVLPEEMRDSREPRSILAGHQARLCGGTGSLPERDWFHGFGVRYLVVYDAPGCPFAREERSAWEARGGIEPAYADDEMLLYDLGDPPAANGSGQGGVDP